MLKESKTTCFTNRLKLLSTLHGEIQVSLGGSYYNLSNQFEMQIIRDKMQLYDTV